MREGRYTSFAEFWPFYVSEHSRSATRVLHLIGTAAGIALMVYLIATARWGLFCDASARNASGAIPLKIWGETLESQKELKPGLWGITGKLEMFQDRAQFV